MSARVKTRVISIKSKASLTREESLPTGRAFSKQPHVTSSPTWVDGDDRNGWHCLNKMEIGTFNVLKLKIASSDPME